MASINEGSVFLQELKKNKEEAHALATKARQAMLETKFALDMAKDSGTVMPSVMKVLRDALVTVSQVSQEAQKASEEARVKWVKETIRQTVESNEEKWGSKPLAKKEAVQEESKWCKPLTQDEVKSAQAYGDAMFDHYVMKQTPQKPICLP